MSCGWIMVYFRPLKKIVRQNEGIKSHMGLSNNCQRCRANIPVSLIPGKFGNYTLSLALW